MDTMDGILTLENLVLATDAVQPYVLSWSLDPDAEELAECTVLALMRRKTGFLPDAVLALGSEKFLGPQCFKQRLFRSACGGLDNRLS